MNVKTYVKFFNNHYPMAYGGALSVEEKKAKARASAREQYKKRMAKNPKYVPIDKRREARGEMLDYCIKNTEPNTRYICNGLKLRHPDEEKKEEQLEKQRIRREMKKVIIATHEKYPNEEITDERFFTYLKNKRPQWNDIFKSDKGQYTGLEQFIIRENRKYNSKKRLSGQGFITQETVDKLIARASKVPEYIAKGKKGFQQISNLYRKFACQGKARPLHEGEIHAPCHNFTGPNTRIDLPEVRNYKPYNNIDNCSRLHDLEYDEIMKLPLGSERSTAIRQADHKALKCYNKYKDESGYKWATTGIKSKNMLENNLPRLSRAIAEKYYGNWL